MSEAISFGRRTSLLAREHPDKTAIVFVPVTGQHRRIGWSELDRSSDRVARLLESRGVRPGSMVVVGLPNCPEHFVAVIAAWKLGACVLPLSWRLPERERLQMVELASPDAVVAEWPELPFLVLGRRELINGDSLPDAPLTDRTPHPGKAIGSGGSTGRPKIIVDPAPWVRIPGRAAGILGEGVRMHPRQVQIVGGPLYHNGPFCWSHWGLFDDHTLVVMERFDAAVWLDLVETYRVNFGLLVPTMMSRIIRQPGVEQRDFSSVETLFHAAAPCPPWLKRAWLDLLGPDRVIEAFGATEGVGATIIGGKEWLEHAGSVGRPWYCELRILDDVGNDLPPGEIGEIFMRPTDTTEPTYYYLGSPPAKTTPDGFVSVGDMGWVDKEGWLYLADRRTDMIISGGANVYPAEVEAVLSEHEGIGDVAVIGVPDEDWGKRVHAVIEPRNWESPLSVAELDSQCRGRLVSYKVPKSYEFVPKLPRDDAGKIRRSLLAAERAGGWTPAMIPTRA